MKVLDEMLKFKERRYVKRIPRGEYVLACDAGGTNTNFGVLHEKKLTLVLSLHFKSKEIKDFTAVVKQVLFHIKKQHNIHAASACFAAAGAQSHEAVCMTNRNFCVDLSRIN